MRRRLSGKSIIAFIFILFAILGDGHSEAGLEFRTALLSGYWLIHIPGWLCFGAVVWGIFWLRDNRERWAPALSEFLDNLLLEDGK